MTEKEKSKNSSKKGVSVKKFLMGVAASALTFLGAQKAHGEYVDDPSPVTEFLPLYAAPEGLKIQFELNAKDVSIYARNDTEACVSYAFADYIAPLAEKLKESFPSSLREELVGLKKEIDTRKEKMRVEYTKNNTGAFPLNFISPFLVEKYQKEIDQFQEKLDSLAMGDALVAVRTVGKFKDLVLYLRQEGLSDSLTLDQMTAAHKMLTLARAKTGNIDYDSTSAVYLATNFMFPTRDSWTKNEINYLSVINGNPRFHEIMKKWEEPKTDKDFEKTQALTKELATIVLGAQFQGYKTVPPVTFYSANDGHNGYYDPQTKGTALNTYKGSAMWRSARDVFALLIHEGTHGLMYSYDTLSSLSGERTVETFQTSDLINETSLNYIRSEENINLYSQHPHEFFAGIAEMTALNYFDNPKEGVDYLKHRQELFTERFNERAHYQQNLAGRGKISCDNFNRVPDLVAALTKPATPK